MWNVFAAVCKMIVLPFKVLYFVGVGVYLLGAFILAASGMLFLAAVAFVLVAALVEPVFVADAAAGIPLWKTWLKLLGYSLLISPVYIILRVMGGGGVFILNK